jgi:hypothetical protein
MVTRKLYRSPLFSQRVAELKPVPAEERAINQAMALLGEHPERGYRILFPFQGVWCYPFGRFRLYYIFSSDELTATTLEA